MSNNREESTREITDQQFVYLSVDDNILEILRY